MPSVLIAMVERQTTSLAETANDTSTNAPSILAINGFFTVLVALIVASRLYVRTFMLGNLGADDYVIVAAVVSTFDFLYPLPLEV
jgi:hypothetical protein